MIRVKHSPASLYKAICITATLFVLCACGRGSSQSDYALGQGSVFTSKDKGKALFGKHSSPQNSRILGYDEINRLMKFKGYDISIDGKEFCLVSKDYASTNALIMKDTYKLHALVNKASKDDLFF